MRYLTVRSTADGAALHPLGRELRDAPGFSREAIHHAELLDDGTVLMLAEGSGDSTRYESVMRESPHVVEFMVSGDERWIAVSQFESSAATERIMAEAARPGVVVDTPIDIDPDGALRITYLGGESALQDLYRSMTGDDPVRVEVLETGSYTPDQNSLTRLLTDRQREVLDAAVEAGYYRTPRAGTHEDVAAALDLAPTTVGEHLRKVEERVFTAIAR
ncbi:helix-turn-helix domain-containing protein [Halostella litorea]|uniref:helix-turn-helix domain-containing protein n=1 Tax=Halostella litorea TaxID=2528831 RepID=UPI0010927CC1|nr:helix-turn-helix domain-containing protein [Halostella litorea]